MTRAVVAEPDLANRTLNKWPNYPPPALDLGACAVFAFPLQIGLGTIGALTLYQDTVGALALEVFGGDLADLGVGPGSTLEIVARTEAPTCP